MSDHRQSADISNFPTGGGRQQLAWLEAAVDYLTVALAVGAAAVLIGVVV